MKKNMKIKKYIRKIKNIKKYPFIVMLMVSILIYGEITFTDIIADRKSNDSTITEEAGSQQSPVGGHDIYVKDDITEANSTEKETPKAETEAETEDNSTQETPAPTDVAVIPEPTETAAPQTQPETPAPKETAAPQAPVETQQPVTSSGDKPVKTFAQVDMSYLDNALFIGDSRTSTLYEYAGWTNTDFYVEYGLTIWSVFEDKIAVDKETGEKISVLDGLSKHKYDKIYIMLGINELGTGTPDIFFNQYSYVVAKIRELQPDAVIFVQSILHVTDAKDNEGTYINNNEINARNAKLQTLADNREIFYIDANQIFDSPGTGKLNAEYTSDGVHIMARFVGIWQDFFLAHGIN